MIFLINKRNFDITVLEKYNRLYFKKSYDYVDMKSWIISKTFNDFNGLLNNIILKDSKTELWTIYIVN